MVLTPLLELDCGIWSSLRFGVDVSETLAILGRLLDGGSMVVIQRRLGYPEADHGSLVDDVDVNGSPYRKRRNALSRS